MFWPFRKTSGWQQVKGSESFVIDMPARPDRKRQTLDTANGQLTLSIYLAKAEGGLTCQVTVRSGPAVATRGDAELVEAWKTEFLTSMAAAGVDIQPLGEHAISGSRELSYQRPDGTVLTRVRLVRDVNNFYAICVIGPAARVQADGERILASFNLT